MCRVVSGFVCLCEPAFVYKSLKMPGSDYNSVEPMQIDVAGEENDNGVEDETFVVENPSLVSKDLRTKPIHTTYTYTLPICKRT